MLAVALEGPAALAVPRRVACKPVGSCVVAPLIAASGVLGAIIGSFLNVVIYRVPKGESIVSPRSKCPGCRHELAARDNVPIVSWLLLRGRCRSCSASISARYPLVEGLTALLFAATAARFGYSAALPAYFVFVASLVALSFIDLDTYLLPKKIVYPALGAGVVALGIAAATTHDTSSALSAAEGALIAFAALFLLHLISPKGMGFGDVRFALLLGLFMGWIELLTVGLGLFLSFLYASVVGIGLMAAKRRGRKDRIPFGPFLAAGAITAVLLGEPILRLYLGRR